jgi:hypothetical protein
MCVFARRSRLAALIAGVGSALVVSVPAVQAVASGESGYARPKGATPLSTSLVLAYEQCAEPNRTHGPPLAFPSCNAPVGTSNAPTRASKWLSMGTADSNGAVANFVGSVRLDVKAGSPGPPEDSDVMIGVSMTDVRCGLGASPCGAANAQDGHDYMGELQLAVAMRITDRFNGSAPGGGTDAATVEDFTLSATVQCSETPGPFAPGTQIGSECSVAIHGCSHAGSGHGRQARDRKLGRGPCL